MRDLDRLLALALMLSLAGTAWATEGLATSRAVGADTIRSGVMPPPGWFVRTAVLDYRADRILDSAGNDRAGISHFDLHVRLAGLHLSYAWPGAELWGARLMTQAAWGYNDIRVSFDVRTPGGTITRKDIAHGWGDTFFGPVALGWRTERTHQMAALLTTLPTGSYNPAKITNPGRGYLAIFPNYALTWFPVEGTEVSASAFYLYNRRNPDTRYRSGREVVVDYGVGYGARPGLQLGASGYLHKQVTDDTQDGQPVAGGNRGQALAFGPFARAFGPGWGLTLKWQREFRVENRFEGNRIILQGALLF